MIKFRYTILLFLQGFSLLFGSLSASGFSGKYPIRNFTPTEYKAGIQNIDFAQNRNMTLFVANNLGILSFNGKEWETHDFKTGKKKRSLAFDESTNRLYMGSQSDFGYYNENWDYISLIDLIPERHHDFTEVWDVFLSNSNVYFCTFQGIYIYDGTAIEVITPEDEFERSFLVNGRIFTQNQLGLLYELEGKQLNRPFQQHYSRKVIAGIVPYDEGLLILYNSGDIELATPFGGSPIFPMLAKTLQGTFVNHVRQLSDTRLAISTQRGGIFLFNLQDQSLERISTREGLASNACLRSFQDYYGNLWVGMQNGIALVHINSPMRLLSHEINLQGSGYEAFETPVGTYFSTSNGIYFLKKGASECVFLAGTEGPAYSIQEIAGKYYAGHHTGLFLLDGQRAIRKATTDGLWQIKQLRSNPAYAIGGTYSGLYLFKVNDQKEISAVQAIRGFSASSRFFEEDPLGHLWVGQYYQGLYQLIFSDEYTSVQVKNISADSDLPIKEQIILSRINNDLYLATNAGIFQINPENATLQEAPLFSEQIGKHPVYLLAQDPRNGIHVVAEHLIAYYQPISNNNYQFKTSSLYELRYHLNNDLLHASVHTENGILFSANDGFIHYDPDLEVDIENNYPLLIRSIANVSQNKILYHRHAFPTGTEGVPDIPLSAKAKVLKIEVESFQFNGLENQLFRYQLQGLEDDFGPWTGNASKEYTNLREGTYTFLAQSKNHLGEVVNGPPVQIVMHAPFYRSTLAKIFYGLLLATGLILLLLMQRRRYKMKEIRAKEFQQKALERKQEALLKIQQNKDKELLQLKEEKMKSEVQHVNKLLAATTMNLVVKNEFIESIKKELYEVIQKGKNPNTKKALDKIVKEIDTNLKVQEDWQQFEYHFDEVHGDFLARFRNEFPDISPNEQKLCVFLRLNLNTKDIANLLGISVRGVEVARYRLRKKLNLETGQNLSKYILEY